MRDIYLTLEKLPIFVYGTLLPGQPNSFLWQDDVASSRPATFEGGRLFDMGHYPMLVEHPDGTVKGLLVEVHPRSHPGVLARLDRLERYDPRQPGKSAYRRVIRDVFLNKGSSRRSWTYLGRAEFVSGQPQIESGDWQAYSAANQSRISAWWAGHSGRLPLDESD